MKKIQYIARKLKTFTFDEIYLISETPKEQIEEILQRLENENFLKKTPQGYIYCEYSKAARMNNKTDKKVKFKVNNTVQIKTLEKSEFENIPEYNLKKYYKYSNLLEQTKGLRGKSLMAFIEKYNQINPNNKTSYASLMKKRYAYAKNGSAGLIAKFGTTRRLYYPDMEQYYSIFKIYYFSKEKYTLNQCREFTANDLNIPLENFPSVMSFRRRLYKDYQPKKLKEIRRNLCF